jgi:hypothetical protein
MASPQTVSAQKRGEPLQAEQKQRQEESFRQQDDGVGDRKRLKGEDPCRPDCNAVINKGGPPQPPDQNHGEDREQHIGHGACERTGQTGDGQ